MSQDPCPGWAHHWGNHPWWGQGHAHPPRCGCLSQCRRQVTAGQLREQGNALFQSGDHAAALAAYTQALSLCDAGTEQAVLHRNRAACYLKLVRAGRVRHRGPCWNLPGRSGLLGLLQPLYLCQLSVPRQSTVWCSLCSPFLLVLPAVPCSLASCLGCRGWDTALLSMPGLCVCSGAVAQAVTESLISH